MEYKEAVGIREMGWETRGGPVLGPGPRRPSAVYSWSSCTAI